MQKPSKKDERPRRPRRPESDRHFVTAVARGLDVLRAFRSGEERLANQEIAARCNLPKSTVTRLTYTLTRQGYLHQLPETRRYRLGLMTLALGGTTLSRLDVREASTDLMQQLADETGTMVSLAILDDVSMLYIATCRAQTSVITLRMDVGSRMPLGTTAIGRCCLAMAPAPQRQLLLERLQTLDPGSADRLQQLADQAVDDLASLRCVCSFGQWRREINAIAVPLRLADYLPPMVINAAAATAVMTGEDFLCRVRPRLLEMVNAIEARYRQNSSGRLE